MTYNLQGKRTPLQNLAGQITTTAWDCCFAYANNTRSELTNAVAAIDAEYRYAYDFDDIGNRIWSLENTNYVQYIANNLNQYTSITSLCDSASLREEFTPQFDLDGNQTLIKTSTGIWSASYNGENRPIFWSNGVTNIVMSFDRMGRRVHYLETAGTSINSNHTFSYDNYVCIACHRVQTDVSIETDRFIWDPTDPIATRPLVFNYATVPTCYYMHDGNKNVSCIVDEGGDCAAHYEYTPFGNTTLSCGAITEMNPWRYSSEYADDAISTTCYNYRHYNSCDARWTARDPLGEDSEYRLYVYAGNNPSSRFDFLGLADLRTCEYVIFAGHSYQIRDMVEGFLNEQDGKEKRRDKCGNRYGAVSCFSNFTNEEINQNPRIPNQGIPGVPLNQSTTHYVDPDNPRETDAVSQLELAWNAAITAAENACLDKDTCCKKIVLSIKCSDCPNKREPGMKKHMEDLEKVFKKKNKNKRRPTDWCSRTKTIICSHVRHKNKQK